MDWIWNFVLCSITIIFLSLLLWSLRGDSGSNRIGLPPGPKGWPVVGNIFDFGTLPHKNIALLKKQYGPIVWLNLGTSINVMVVQSSDAAEELFKNFDLLFTDRYVTETMRSHGYDNSSIGVVSYSTHWRLSRRIVSLEMLVNKKLNEKVSMRGKCVDQLLGWIDKEVDSEDEGKIRFVFSAVFNLIGNLLMSSDLVDINSSEMASEFFTAIAGMSKCLVHPNISDLFDLQGLRRKMDHDMGKALRHW